MRDVLPVMQKMSSERDCNARVIRLYVRIMKHRRDISILATAAMPLATRPWYCARLSGSEQQSGNPDSACDGGSIG
jgi:hypothetical protein